MSKVKKIVLPWLLALVMVVGSCVPVMAVEYNGIDFPVLYDGNDLYITFNQNGVFRCLIFAPDTVLNSAVVSSGRFDYSFTSSEISFLYDYNSSNSSWSYTASYGGGSVIWTSDIVYTDFDIYDSDGNVVFQAPAPPLVEVVRGVQPETLTKEILTMIPLLIPLLAGYLGLRKALREVSAILKTA